jgi:hypothetical protein
MVGRESPFIASEQLLSLSHLRILTISLIHRLTRRDGRVYIPFIDGGVANEVGGAVRRHFAS